MRLILLCLLLALARPSPADPAPPAPVESPSLVFAIDGHSIRLTQAEMEAWGATDAEWSVHGKRSRVHGVPLDRLLEHVGFSPGPMGRDVPKTEKRSGWKKVLVASAADGFSAVFSCAELMPSMGPTRALLAWTIDGQPLPPEQGPYRIVVLTDQEPSRSIFALQRLEVIDMRSVKPATDR